VITPRFGELLRGQAGLPHVAARHDLAVDRALHLPEGTHVDRAEQARRLTGREQVTVAASQNPVAEDCHRFSSSSAVLDAPVTIGQDWGAGDNHMPPYTPILSLMVTKDN